MSEKGFTNKEMVEFYFKTVGDEYEEDGRKKREYTCQCGVRRVQDLKAGFGNLLSHIHKDHSNAAIVMGAAKNLADKSIAKHLVLNPDYPVNEKANWIFGWLEWTIEGNKSFDFCENPVNRKYSKLRVMSTGTLLKYMKLVSDAIVVLMTSEMQKAKSPIGLVSDGWRNTVSQTENGPKFGFVQPQVFLHGQSVQIHQIQHKVKDYEV